MSQGAYRKERKGSWGKGKKERKGEVKKFGEYGKTVQFALDHLDGRITAGKKCGDDNEENKGKVRKKIRRKIQGTKGRERNE